MLAKTIQTSENKENTRIFIDAVKSGQFYEEFGKLIGIDTSIDENRKKVKKSVFSAIFSPNQIASHVEEIKLFSKHFPSVMAVFKKIKTSVDSHRTLACVLQNFEADLILHTACKRISEINPDVPMFTLHDSIITIPEHQELVEKIMLEVLTEAIGFPPKLKIEIWGRVA